MALRKQNRTIWTLAAVVFFLLLILLFQDARFEGLLEAPPTELSLSDSMDAEEQFGEKVESPSLVDADQPEQEQFAEVLNQMVRCLKIPGNELSAPLPLEIETLFRKVERDFGPVLRQKDRWIIWHLKSPEEQIFQLRLEILEEADGRIRKQLSLMKLSPDGQQTPVEISSEKSLNPSDEIVSQMLKAGQVIYKERAASAFFVNNERVDYMLINEALSEIEVISKVLRFRCPNMATPQTCQCL